ncbi:hypothetical protein LJC23_01920 [Desulfovibrio sp. OttesenSCG-928-I05]|nr:hypothetical protein [Desulfovibrio sp. OttesenSCG-928-I05]
MRILRINGLLGLLTALAVSVFLAGCGTTSRVPVPEYPQAYIQEVSQAADHWRDIASDVAERVRVALLERRDLLDKPIFLTAPNSRDFDLAFFQLLKTEMVSRAVQVSESIEPEGIRMDYLVQTVYHDPSRLGAGGPRYGAVSDHEIVVNVHMSYHNRYVLHLSYTRYINDADWPLYISPESQEPAVGRARTIRVIGR